MTVADRYARFRGGKWFLIALTLFVSTWIVWNLLPDLPHFDDPGFGRLNLFLSTEASLSVALLIMASEREEAAQREQLRYIRHQTQAILALLEASGHVARDRTPDPNAGRGLVETPPV